MKLLRFARTVVAIMIKDRIYYTGKLFVDTLSVFARFGVVVLLYKYVFELRGGSVLGVPFVVAAWSMFFYFAVMTLDISRVARSIMRDIQSGTIEVLFSKPIPYLWYKVFYQIGMHAYPFILISFFGSILLALVFGVPQTMTTSFFFLTFVATFLLGILLCSLLYTLIGLAAFWIEDINPIYWVVDKGVMILGGSYLPVGLFPPLMYKIALWSPFGASYFVTHTVYEGWAQLWVTQLLIQTVWVLVLGILVMSVFYKARQKVSVNGG